MSDNDKIRSILDRIDASANLAYQTAEAWRQRAISAEADLATARARIAELEEAIKQGDRAQELLQERIATLESAVLPDEVARSVSFLKEAARYFENRPTGGEDHAHWANVYNAKNAREAAALLTRLSRPMATVPDVEANDV